MINAFARFVKNAPQTLQHPRLLFWLLPYFMLVIIAGTVAQKYVGLFAATDQFFNRFVYWVGPVPVPVGASALALLFLSLFAHFISNSQWHIKQLGTTLAHLGVLILLFGGGVTLASKSEGFMILRQNQPTVSVYDYHQREFLIYHKKKIVWRGNPEQFVAGRDLALPVHLPFGITPTGLCRNCTISAKNELQTQPPSLDDEVNQSGIAFTMTHQGRSNRFVTTEFMGRTPEFEGYSFALQRRKQKLPFTLLLKDFSQNHYAGTDIAKSYQSSLLLLEDGRDDWPVRISMNDPLRYQGYTFYQSSVLHLPNGELASVLNVVDNAGWLFPYLATGLLAAGLLLQAWSRYARS